MSYVVYNNEVVHVIAVEGDEICIHYGEPMWVAVTDTQPAKLAA